MAALIRVSKKKAEQLFWLYIKEYSFVSNTWETCPFNMNLKHKNVIFLR